MNKEAAAAITDATDLAAQGIGLLASHGQAAQAAATLLRSRYRWADEREAELLVALGGDGFMLHTLHQMLDGGEVRPVFGMNRGTVGFLMNDWRLDCLGERIAAAKAISVAPLTMRAVTIRTVSSSTSARIASAGSVTGLGRCGWAAIRRVFLRSNWTRSEGFELALRGGPLRAM